jgi:SAM-dependent methyltransferase
MSQAGPPREPDEPSQVVARYDRRRAQASVGDRYSILRPEVWQTVHERQRALLGLFAQAGLADLSRLRLAEVGCGSGGNLLELLRLGLAPQHLTGIELLPERCAAARAVLPAATQLHQGDAVHAPIEPGSLDLVLQATVFSSLLDGRFQQRLADTMWHWLRPGGAVIWYDFCIDNPRNPDVRGVPLARVRQLFPQAVRLRARRVTLAPPLARALCAVHPALYTVFNAWPLLRTHRLAWIEKPLAA